MIRTHQEVRMANDGLDENGLQNGFLKTVQDELSSNIQVWLGNLLNFAKNVVAIRNSFRKLLSII